MFAPAERFCFATESRQCATQVVQLELVSRITPLGARKQDQAALACRAEHASRITPLGARKQDHVALACRAEHASRIMPLGARKQDHVALAGVPRGTRKQDYATLTRCSGRASRISPLRRVARDQRAQSCRFHYAARNEECCDRLSSGRIARHVERTSRCS